MLVDTSKVGWNIGHRRCHEKMSFLGGPTLKKIYIYIFTELCLYIFLRKSIYRLRLMSYSPNLKSRNLKAFVFQFFSTFHYCIFLSGNMPYLQCTSSPSCITPWKETIYFLGKSINRLRLRSTKVTNQRWHVKGKKFMGPIL